MKRTHAFLIALALGIAVVAGTFAALRTTQLGARRRRRHASQLRQIAQQNRALDRAEAALRGGAPPQAPGRPAARRPLPALRRSRRLPPPAADRPRHPPPGGEHERSAATAAGPR